MPPLNIMNILADLYFVGQMKKLPVDWEQPQGKEGGEGSATDKAANYGDGFSMKEKMGIPEPLCYFWAASTNEYHVNTCKDVGKIFKDFVHNMLDAIKFAVDMWRLQAKFKDLKVMSVCAIGTPGCLDGPKLDIKNAPQAMSMKSWGDNIQKWIDAVADGVADCWEQWQKKVMVPGLPFYPAFAAYPLATAPPLPNVPFPLITCPSPMMTKMTPTQLQDAMVGKLDSSIKDEDSDKQYEACFGAIGTALSVAFLMWLPSQQIMLVMGKGPVPTYAPPYVPVGPVIGGDNIAAPGHLAV
jgi:hypothetical protein